MEKARFGLMGWSRLTIDRKSTPEFGVRRLVRGSLASNSVMGGVGTGNHLHF